MMNHHMKMMKTSSYCRDYAGGDLIDEGVDSTLFFIVRHILATLKVKEEDWHTIHYFKLWFIMGLK